MQTELLKGTLNTLILKVLSDNGQMYGYELTQHVKKLTDGKIILKEGSLYPMLHKMLNEGLLVTEDEYIGKRLRRHYKITEVGRAKADEQVENLIEFFEMMKSLMTSSTKRQ